VSSCIVQCIRTCEPEEARLSQMHSSQYEAHIVLSVDMETQADDMNVVMRSAVHASHLAEKIRARAALLKEPCFGGLLPSS
jgi:hypothetical protein